MCLFLCTVLYVPYIVFVNWLFVCLFVCTYHQIYIHIEILKYMHFPNFPFSVFCLLFVCKYVMYCCVLIVCKCVMYCCHRVSTKLR
jgi:hypothetical protein